LEEGYLCTCVCAIFEHRVDRSLISFVLCCVPVLRMMKRPPQLGSRVARLVCPPSARSNQHGGGTCHG